MSVSGAASISLTYTDATAAAAKVVTQQLSLTEDADMSSGVVALLTGTVGTASISLAFDPTSYRDANGNLVSFTGANAPTRIAFQASGPNEVRLKDNDLQIISLYSKNNIIASSTWGGDSTVDSGVNIEASSGTASYAILIVREE